MFLIGLAMGFPAGIVFYAVAEILLVRCFCAAADDDFWPPAVNV